MSATLAFSLMMVTSAVGAGHPCAFGQAIAGDFAAFQRGDSFTLQGSDQLYVPADIVLGEVGGKLALQRESLVLYFAGHGVDRYGRQPVHLFQNNRWVQGDVLTRGRGLAFPATESGSCRKALLDAESKNTAKRGLHWRTRGVEIDANDLATLSQRMGRFVMVTGTVRSVGDRKRRIYLNFGSNWAHDFTVSAAKRGVGKFTGDLRRLTGLTGRKVQIRGVLENSRGPLIRVIDDVQVQIIK